MIVLKALYREDIPGLQDLLEKCADYLEFQDEGPVSSTAAERLFQERPENIGPENKTIFGIYLKETQALIGVFDIITEYPDPTTLCLGLLLIDPAYRDKGNGMTAYCEFEKWALSRKISRIRLGVLDGNDQGLKFWNKAGYTETGERKPYKTKMFKVLEKHI